MELSCPFIRYSSLPVFCSRFIIPFALFPAPDSPYTSHIPVTGMGGRLKAGHELQKAFVKR